jgi:hypothetical protein
MRDSRTLAVDGVPELLMIAREVRKTGRPTVLQVYGEVIAVVVPR